MRGQLWFAMGGLGGPGWKAYQDWRRDRWPAVGYLPLLRVCNDPAANNGAEAPRISLTCQASSGMKCVEAVCHNGCIGSQSGSGRAECKRGEA
jgi:hypothetical protein